MQTEQGAWEPILPMPELDRMYQHILTQKSLMSASRISFTAHAQGQHVTPWRTLLTS